ncbi:MAG: hypothetical protein RIQ97_2723 [Pseudomonadota bacterium]|jgi:ATP-binding cassette subfamily C exporter for protease/lipase
MSTKPDRTLRSMLLQFKRPLLWVGFFSAVANLLSLTPTLYMLQVYDRIMISQNEITLIVLSLLVLLFFMVMTLAEWLRSRLLVRLGVKLDDEVNLKVFERGFTAYLRQGGANPNEALQDLMTLRQFLTGNGVLAFYDLPWIPVFIGASFLLHHELGIAALVFAVIQLVIAIWIERHTAGTHRPISEANHQTRRFMQAKLRSAELIDAMGMRSKLFKRWLTRNEAYTQLQDQQNEFTQRQMLLSKYVQYAQQSLILGLGALLVIDNKISPGAMVAANLLMGKALQPLQSVVMAWRGFLSARESYERLNDLFVQSVDDPLRGTHAPETLSVRFEEVTVQYPGRTRPALGKLNLEIPAGQTVLVLGPSGSGKTTLARLVMGEDVPHTGRVLIDAHPAAHCRREDIGYLPQSVELIEGTVAENIGRFDTTEPEKIVQAARAAQAHDLVQHLPLGYDTPVGLAGQLLSGGQRQRVALARALYDKPRLVVLDEPNASLDEQGEKALMEAIRQLKANGVTVLIISHRPNVLPLADRVLMMQAGMLVQDLPADRVRVAPAPAPASGGPAA